MKLTSYQLEAWEQYQATLIKFNESHRVLMYDRVSIHEAFPEIKAAFDRACAMSTWRALEGVTDNEQ